MGLLCRGLPTIFHYSGCYLDTYPTSSLGYMYRGSDSYVIGALQPAHGLYTSKRLSAMFDMGSTSTPAILVLVSIYTTRTIRGDGYAETI
jgi:hypothetical protein